MVTRAEADEVNGRTIDLDRMAGPPVRAGAWSTTATSRPHRSVRPRGWRAGAVVVILFARAGVAEWHTQRT